MINNEHTYAVILAGGGGTRLWPKSRIKTPKQFLKLDSDDTMLQAATERAAKIVDWKKIIVVTNEIYREEVKKQLPQVLESNIIAEPRKRDTALAMLVGALYAKNLDPKAIVVNMASDHVVTNQAEFLRVMKAAVETAAEGNNLVTVGISPTFPTSALGYIKIGEDLKKLAKGLSLFKVDSFTEKPNIPTARAFIATGKYFWNANMYVWSVEALQKAFAKYFPEMYEQTKELDKLSSSDFNKALPKIYENAETISIDYAISEKADNLVLIPGDFGWSDVGDWKVVYDLGKKDLSGNVIAGEEKDAHVLIVESSNNMIHTDGRLIAMVGIKDMVVIDTGEILMICPKNRTQEVKKLVNKLKEEKRQEYL